MQFSKASHASSHSLLHKQQGKHRNQLTNTLYSQNQRLQSTPAPSTAQRKPLRRTAQKQKQKQAPSSSSSSSSSSLTSSSNKSTTALRSKRPHSAGRYVPLINSNNATSMYRQKVTSNLNRRPRNPSKKYMTSEENLASSLRKELRAAHQILTCVPSPRRRVVKAGARAVAAASQHSSLTFGRNTLDLYASVGLEEAQTTTERLCTRLRSAMLDEQNVVLLQKLRDESARELVRRCEELGKNIGIVELSKKENVSSSSFMDAASNISPNTNTKGNTNTNDKNGLIAGYVLPLVQIVVSLEEDVQRQRRLVMRMEKSVTRADKRAKSAEEEASLIRMTLESHLDTVRGPNRRRKDHVVIGNGESGFASSSTTSSGSTLSSVVTVETSDVNIQTTEVLIFDNEMKKHWTQKIKNELKESKQLLDRENSTLKRRISMLKAENTKLLTEARSETYSLEEFQNMANKQKKEATKLLHAANAEKNKMEQQLLACKKKEKSRCKDLATMKLEMQALLKNVAARRKGNEEESDAFRSLVQERGKLLAQIKNTNEDYSQLRSNLIDAESMNNRLSSELEAERLASRTLTRRIQTMEATHQDMMQQFKADQQTAFDRERLNRRTSQQQEQEAKQVKSLEATLESERRLVFMKEKQFEETQLRLKEEVKSEVHKAQQLQEELEAANLCMEVRRSEQKKKDREWVENRTALENELDELRAEINDNSSEGNNIKQGKLHANFVNNNDSRRLRSQINTMKARMETQKASHGRQIGLLRTELSLEQKRTEQLAKEVNLLRMSDSTKYEMKRVNNSTTMVDHTLSSLRDRAMHR